MIIWGQRDRNPGSSKRGRAAATLVCAALLSSCAADPEFTTQLDTTQQAEQTQAEVAANLTGAKITFQFANFYSLTSPNPDTRCAGDATTYYDPFAYANATIGEAMPLQTSVTDPSITIQPPFIKNISVDLSDSNTLIPSNLAYSCSYGATATAPPPSNCSTFDYGAAAGLYSTMAGSILMVGGIQGYNYVGPLHPTTGGGLSSTVACGQLTPNAATAISNECATSVYALGVDTLPPSAATNPPNALAPGLTAASGPISTWANLAATTGYAGPPGVAGAAATFDPGLRVLVVFGGISGTTDLPVTNTWSFNFATQAWTALTFTENVDLSMISMPDDNGSFTINLAKGAGGRTGFGYTTLPGVAIQKLDGGVFAGNLDFTDRLAIVGGYDAGGVATDAHILNPTFGPQLVDAIGEPTGPLPNQWVDSYYMQLLSNSLTSSLYEPKLPTSAAPSPSPSPVAGFGLIGLADSGAGGAGALVAIGGFDTGMLQNTEIANGGGFTVGGPFLTALASLVAGDVTMIPNSLIATANNELLPIEWEPFTEGAAPAAQIPWYGGVSVVPGLAANDIVYFGGTDVTNYISAATSPTTANFNNPGRYFSTVNPISGGTNVPATTGGINNSGMNGTVPAAAGMAAANGFDPDGDPIVVAWGGETGLGGDTAFQKIYTLAEVGATPTWTSVPMVGVNSPTYYVNSSLVYSHVTGNFYLFGGYSPLTKTTSADTWKLTITSPVGSRCGPSQTCTYAWTQLDVSGGLSCSPVCPTARQGHRMAEVNYFNTAPNSTPAALQPTCTAAAPCSFGIFMEGGSPNAITTAGTGDRWMFDPTASAGFGAWLKIQDMPPRSLGAMSAADYNVPATAQTVHRAVLFGGETAMQNPLMAENGKYYVPPTLGDTWIFDFDALTWNRAILLGQGYSAIPPGTLAGLQLGEAFTNGSVTELSPPATSGAMMVTRTNGPNGPLAVPEIYLIGGRTKDGKYVSLNQVYKFCLGTAQERSLDATCWDYDPELYDGTLNPAPGASPSPHVNQPVNTYTGRWFLKAPPLAPLGTTAGTVPDAEAVSSYLGAATYDPLDDKIVLFGGLSPEPGNALAVAVTQTGAGFQTGTGGNNALNTGTGFTTTIYEYTPPAGTAPAAADGGTAGSWQAIGPCALSNPPSGFFYAHTMSYDSLNHQLVIVGGYNTNGTPNVTTSGIPAVWAAKREPIANPGVGKPAFCYDWNPITIFGNSDATTAQAPPLGGIAYAASLYVPADGYNSGYYMTYDSSCVGAGPIAVSDPTLNRLLAGDVYFDIDRTQLGPNENLLLNLTYLPMGATMQAQSGTQLTADDEAYFKIHLVRTGQSVSQLQATVQPRYLTYAATDQFPEVVEELAVLAPPTGQVRAEQIMLPISSDPSIDRIQIQRYSGSAVLIDASLYRMGYR